MTILFNKRQMKERRQALRSSMTPAEEKLWSKLRRKQLGGLRFRRQYSIDSYVVDFHCPELSLTIEVDGGVHDRLDVKEYDEERQKYLEDLGVTVIRFRNSDVERRMRNVLKRIQETAKALKKSSSGSSKE